MDKPTNTMQWFRYLETPIKKNVPVKLDQILAARMAAFLEAKDVASIDLSETSDA